MTQIFTTFKCIIDIFAIKPLKDAKLHAISVKLSSNGDEVFGLIKVFSSLKSKSKLAIKVTLNAFCELGALRRRGARGINCVVCLGIKNIEHKIVRGEAL